MKKRFTIMLEEEVIRKIKQLGGYWKPSALRENIQDELEAWTDYQLDELLAKDFNESKGRYQFDD